MSKRELDSKTDDKTAKKAHIADGNEAAFAQLKEIQSSLTDQETLCAKEQIVIQRKYEEVKQPLYAARQGIIEKIPNFWGTVISKHPTLRLISDEEKEVLQFIKSVHIQDNLDEFGSYKVTMQFNEGAAAIFEPLTLEKEVTFDEAATMKVKSFTKINFKEGKELKTSEDYPSALVWFAKEASEDDDDDDDANVFDFGEVLRREIFQSPHLYTFMDSFFLL